MVVVAAANGTHSLAAHLCLVVLPAILKKEGEVHNFLFNPVFLIQLKATLPSVTTEGSALVKRVRDRAGPVTFS